MIIYIYFDLNVDNGHDKPRRNIKNMAGDAGYKSFAPISLPSDPPAKHDDDMITLLVKADHSIAALQQAYKEDRSVLAEAVYF